LSALSEALLCPANRPGPLVIWLAGLVNPSADLRGLEDGGGAFCDFRRGLEEQDPSLSVSMGSQGAVFNRFGGDGSEGGAVDFVMSCLGVSKGEAARLLIDRAGIVDTPAEHRKPVRAKVPSMKNTPAKEDGGKVRRFDAARTLGKLSEQGPVKPDALAHALRGWVRLTADEDSPEAAELARRGLLPALACGLLTAYRFTGQSGPDGGQRQTFRLPRHVLPGAVAFEVRGPDGQAWAVKVRNPGSKEELKVSGKTRYAYLTKGGHSPAWCSPGFEGDPARPVLIVEGELNAAATVIMLRAVSLADAYRVQGVASADSWPHVQNLGPGAAAFLYADPDPEGMKAREAWAKLCAHLGVAVRQLPEALFGVGDACEQLPTALAEELGGHLLTAIRDAPLWTPHAPLEAVPEYGRKLEVWTGKKTGYRIDGGRLCAFTLKQGDGEEYEALEVLCEFSALITAQVTQEDGTGEVNRVFEIEGFAPGGKPMNPPRITVKAAEFNGMAWPVANWGAGAIVRAGSAKKDKAREAIQQLSAERGMAERTVYQFTGWIQHEQHGPLYLTAAAVIGAAGGVEGVDVDLSGRLAAYALPDPAKEEASAIRSAVRASLALLDLAPDSVSVPVMGAVYRAPLGRLTAVVWLTGETGRNKTTYLALAQSHYGAGWTAQHLPDSWNTTPNALEQSAFAVKDAPFLIDDFKPAGSKTDVDRAHGNVSRIVQGAADGAGRGRMNYKTGGTKAGYYPRGTVVSSAEQLPRGHSNRARAVLVDVDRPLIDSPAKSEAYHLAADTAAEGVYALALAAYVQTLAGHLDAVKVDSPAHRRRTRELAPHFEGAHGRTGPAAAELAHGWEVFLSFAWMVGAVSQAEAAHIWARVLSALEDTAAGQGEHLHQEDPVNRALNVLAGLLAQGRVYLEDLGGGVPVEPEAAGWQRHTFELHGGGEGEDFKPRPNATLLGYVDRSGGDTWAYFFPDALHEALQGVATRQGGAALPDAAGLWANMRDRFHPRGLMRCETEKTSGRVRPFAKLTAKGKRERLLCLRFPLDLDSYFLGTVGTLGTDSLLTPSSTLSSSVPTLSYFSNSLGTVGTVGLSPSPVSAFAASMPEAEENWAVTV